MDLEQVLLEIEQEAAPKAEPGALPGPVAYERTLSRIRELVKKARLASEPKPSVVATFEVSGYGLNTPELTGRFTTGEFAMLTVPPEFRTAAQAAIKAGQRSLTRGSIGS